MNRNEESSLPGMTSMPNSLVDEVWNTLTAVLQWRLKKNSNSTRFIELYFGVSEQIKPLQPIGLEAEFRVKFESKFEPLFFFLDFVSGDLALTGFQLLT